MPTTNILALSQQPQLLPVPRKFLSRIRLNRDPKGVLFMNEHGYLSLTVHRTHMPTELLIAREVRIFQDLTGYYPSIILLSGSRYREAQGAHYAIERVRIPYERGTGYQICLRLYAGVFV